MRAKEPIFGTGALPFFVQLVGLGVSLALIIVVLMLARGAYSSVHATLWGEPQQQAAPHLEPGESTTVNGVTIKRID